MAAGRPAPDLPDGTVTVLLTEVERSNSRWETAPDGAGKAIARHGELIAAAVAAQGGVQAPMPSGDGAAVAVFGSAVDAVHAALAIHRSLANEAWPEGLAVRVRTGLHTGEARGRDRRGYAGAARLHGARLRDAAHGGQILLSAVTASIVADAVPEDAWLVDRGEHRLRDLSRAERIFELCHAGAGDGLPPLRTLDVLPNNLPAQLTSFVGRRAELAEVEGLLVERRSVTLTGAGGCGKTRLALQAAAELAERWPDGVWWIELEAVSDPTLVARVAASALGLLVEPLGGPLRALRSHLRDRRMLVCLDTCEHVVHAAAELADTLLRGCPDVSVLATSREPLRIAGELVWRVPSLVADEARELFADRAALVHAGFATGATDDAAVDSLCRRLDGIPLAIELAAAWVRAFTPTQIATGLDDRFRLLVRGPRGAIERHRTLAASMEWSHRLLDATDRIVFRRLAVFAGPFTLDATRAVCAMDPVSAPDVAAALLRLSDKSLVVEHEANGESRYRLLDTIREYASAQLDAEGEAEALRHRHLDHFLALAEKAEPGLDRDQDLWRRRLEADHDNLRAAVEWGLGLPDAERGRRLAAALARLWFLHGHTQEGSDLLARAIDRAPDERSTLQARLLAGAALVSCGRGQVAESGALAARGLEVAAAVGDEGVRARCLGLQGIGTFYFDFSATHELGMQAERHGEAAGDVHARDFGLLLQATMCCNRDRHDESVPLAERLYSRTRPRGERFLAAIARACDVWACLFTGDLRRAEALGVESVQIAEPLGDYLTVGHTISNLAWVKCLTGEIEAGLQLMEPVARSIEAAGPDVELASLGLILGKLHLARGDLAAAITWFERAGRYAAPQTDNWVTARALPCEASALRRLGRVDEARECVDRAVQLGRRLDVPHAVAEALEQAAFLTADEDPERAEDLHHDAFAIRVGRGLRTFYVDSLDALAGLAAGAESYAEATRLAAASDAAREVIGYQRPPIDRADHDTVLAGLRFAQGDDAFDAAWAEGSALALDEAVAYACRARGARRRPSSGWVSLTPTELDVARLVVEGLSNLEIGARLFIGRATVKTHLSHIYTKLGVSNRTGLATVASRRLR